MNGERASSHARASCAGEHRWRLAAASSEPPPADRTPGVDFATALDVLIDAQRAGKVRHIALSNVTVEQLEQAEQKTPVVAVQNLFNLTGGSAAFMKAPDNPEAVLATCEKHGIAFMPYFPLATGTLTAGGGSLEAAAKRHRCSPAQLAIAWLLARSPVMLPIPGTGKVAHLEENIGAVHVAVDATTVAELAPNAAS